MSEAPQTAGRAYLTLAASAIGFALGYALPGYARLPSLYYDPLARGFLFGAKPGSLPMGYLGQVLYGVAGALAVGGATHFWGRAKKRAPSDQALLLAGAWVLTALLLVGAYFTWNNWP